MNEHRVEQLLRELAKRLPPERLFSEERAERIRRQLHDSVGASRDDRPDERPPQAFSHEDRGATS